MLSEPPKQNKNEQTLTYTKKYYTFYYPQTHASMPTMHHDNNIHRKNTTICCDPKQHHSPTMWRTKTC
eukprot:1366625-Amorphochlora_amoeboformis.AAC.1